MADQPLYVGSGKKVETQNGGFVNVSVCLDQIPQEHTNTDKQGRKWVNLVLSKRREVGQYGETHSVKINTWKPDKQKSQQSNSDNNW